MAKGGPMKLGIEVLWLKLTFARPNGAVGSVPIPLEKSMTGGPGSTMPPVNDPVYSPANVVAFATSDFVPQINPINISPRTTGLIAAKLEQLFMTRSLSCAFARRFFRHG